MAEKRRIVSVDQYMFEGELVILPRVVDLRRLPDSGSTEFWDHYRYSCEFGQVYIDCPYNAVFLDSQGRALFKGHSCYDFQVKYLAHSGSDLIDDLDTLTNWTNRMMGLYGEEHFPLQRETRKIRLGLRALAELEYAS